MPLFDRAYAQNPGGFADALIASRDYMGFAMAALWERLSIETLDYADVYKTFIEVDEDMTRGRYGRIIHRNMQRRGIGIVKAGPRLKPPDEESHAFSGRTATPEGACGCSKHRIPYSLRRKMARNAR